MSGKPLTGCVAGEWHQIDAALHYLGCDVSATAVTRTGLAGRVCKFIAAIKR